MTLRDYIGKMNADLAEKPTKLVSLGFKFSLPNFERDGKTVYSHQERHTIAAKCYVEGSRHNIELPLIVARTEKRGGTYGEMWIKSFEAHPDAMVWLDVSLDDILASVLKRKLDAEKTYHDRIIMAKADYEALLNSHGLDEDSMDELLSLRRTAGIY
jgi:hypothetical protein